MTYYYYGMRLRGFSIGCQPKEGFQSCLEYEKFKSLYPLMCLRFYHNVLAYDRYLTQEEMYQYDLDFIGIIPADFGK